MSYADICCWRWNAESEVINLDDKKKNGLRMCLGAHQKHQKGTQNFVFPTIHRIYYYQKLLILIRVSFMISNGGPANLASQILYLIITLDHLSWRWLTRASIFFGAENFLGE